MKKYEMEKLLLEPEASKTLAARAEYIRTKYGATGSTAGAARDRVAQLRPIVEAQQTPGEIKANDEDFVVRSGATIDLTRFVPDFRDAEAKPLLRLMISKYREKASPTDLMFLENTVHQLVSQGEQDPEAQKLIDQAIELLENADKPRE